MKLTKIESMREQVDFKMELHQAHKNGLETKTPVTIEEGEIILKKVTRRKFVEWYTRDGVFYAHQKKNKYLCCPSVSICRKLNYYIIKLDDESCSDTETIIYRIN